MEKKVNEIKYTPAQRKVIAQYFKKQFILFIFALIFLIGSIIMVSTKDFMSLKSTNFNMYVAIVIASFLLGITCSVLTVINYLQMNKYIKKADKQNGKR